MESTLTAIRSLVSTIFAPGVPEVLKDFHTDNSSLASLMVSIYVMGSAVGPLVLTPITEMSGRLPVTHGANILFMIAAIVCASSINISMLIVSRLIMGIASSVPVTVGGGFVADMMPMERRGTAMTIWTVGPLLVLSLYSSVTYSYMYILFTTFTDVFENVYGFSPGQAGLGYLGLGMGFCVGQITVGYYSDRHVKKQEKIHGKMKPEHRLPPLVLGCFLVPIGLFWYGWSAQYRLHWIVPIIGTFFIGAGIFYVHLVTQVYLVDSYTLYAASAVSAELALRCVFGATIPLAGTPLYDTLGLGWGNTLLGFIALAFAPTSFFLLKYGESIRTNPKFMPKMT
ncbi:unnamed protein product [Aspergillus oryzae]|uniref:Unnamed protein product n=2 Tax=Aspergillus oryzae TaxID=5062 RepID=A0AAN5BX28_ASPOZ|nr:unnamed protein product [Aspergillus oryzae]GMF88882.1 unnamed protein product [Aspergillus oryzae]GMG28785.1 unnamed protein product [Aspergillus oryzae]GMG44435.1 unnamed protein product [Aspergillus oryzae var. brunneus]